MTKCAGRLTYPVRSSFLKYAYTDGEGRCAAQSEKFAFEK